MQSSLIESAAFRQMEINFSIEFASLWPALLAHAACSCEGRNTLVQLGGMQFAAVDREKSAVLIGPHSRFAVQGALDVVRLVGDHFRDSHDQFDKFLAGRPMVTHTNRSRLDVGMKMGDSIRHLGLWRG